MIHRGLLWTVQYEKIIYDCFLRRYYFLRTTILEQQDCISVCQCFTSLQTWSGFGFGSLTYLDVCDRSRIVSLTDINDVHTQPSFSCLQLVLISQAFLQNYSKRRYSFCGWQVSLKIILKLKKM